MAYRWVAAAVEGFVQQLAVAYIAHGYWFYVRGWIPEHKDAAATDRKILRQYGIAVSKWSRARRKKTGQANVQYLRYGRFYVILATHGQHPFFAAEQKQIQDFRRHPLYFMGYSIGCRRARGGGDYHASVRIQREIHEVLKARFRQAAIQKSVEELERELWSIPYERYAPVRSQLLGILRVINRRRQVAGLEPVPREALRLRRFPVRPFGAETGKDTTNPAKEVVRNRPWPTTAFDG